MPNYTELEERLRLRERLCMQYRNSYFDVVGLFGPAILTLIVDRCNQRDMRLAIEAQRAVISTVANGGHGGSRRLNTLLELQTVLCTEYRNVYFTVINLIGAGVFSFVEDNHRQRDGILEAEAARVDDMIERIKCAAD